METLRKPYQGVLNIIRFNWHFYAIASVSVIGLLVASLQIAGPMSWVAIAVSVIIIISTALSLSVSYYIYDLSGFYDFPWMRKFKNNGQTILNIHAGFDETSSIIKKHFSGATLEVYDFYNPAKHTEISIERARKAYPQFAGTIKITTGTLPVSHNSIDLIFNIFSLHEVRDRAERITFLKAQAEALNNNGHCIIVEHLRDTPNFAAYNIGFLHFYPEVEWLKNFSQAGLTVQSKFKVTRFITVFILKKSHGITP